MKTQKNKYIGWFTAGGYLLAWLAVSVFILHGICGHPEDRQHGTDELLHYFKQSLNSDYYQIRSVADEDTNHHEHDLHCTLCLLIKTGGISTCDFPDELTSDILCLFIPVYTGQDVYSQLSCLGTYSPRSPPPFSFLHTVI